MAGDQLLLCSGSTHVGRVHPKLKCLMFEEFSFAGDGGVTAVLTFSLPILSKGLQAGGLLQLQSPQEKGIHGWSAALG